jgi:hypothetical protein
VGQHGDTANQNTGRYAEAELLDTLGLSEEAAQLHSQAATTP